MVDNSELLQRIEKLEKQVELLQAEITAIKSIEVSEKAHEQIDKMERANKLVSLIENLSGEKMPDAQKDDEIEVLQNISQQAEKEVQSSIGTIEEFINNSADESDFEWKLYKNGIEITKYVGMSKKTVVIPNNIAGKSVISIGKEAFKNCLEVERVKLPQFLKHIGEYSFYNCENLIELSIPNSVQEIGSLAFYNTGIASVKIPEVKSLANEVFSCCKNLKNVIFPNSLEVVGAYAFSQCTNLNKIYLPNGVLRIEYHAFSGCKNLSEIHLPQTLNYIGKWSLSGTSIKSIKFPNSGVIFDECIFGSCENVMFGFEGMVDAFENDIVFKSFDGGTFYCLPGSSAQQYARENNIPVKHLSEFEKDMQEEK